MKKYKIILLAFIVFPAYANAGGPVIPDEYRALSDKELSSQWRNTDQYHFSLISGDFNGDSLVDGATLAIELNSNELVLLAFLAKSSGNNFQWYKLASSKHDSIKYMGVAKNQETDIYYYKNLRSESKDKMTISNDSIKYFASEGPASVFYWGGKNGRFERLWVSK